MNLNDEYFEWMHNIICGKRFSKDNSYEKLLSYLHSVEFTFVIPNDENRAIDGIDLRRRFAIRKGDEDLADYISGPCSILEMMLALSIRCEESIMDDPNIGDRTSQWFWIMVRNLGLGGMNDSYFDEDYITDVITRFLNRDYEPNGRGGLFYIKNCEVDLRRVEIWYQLNWFLDSIV